MEQCYFSKRNMKGMKIYERLFIPVKPAIQRKLQRNFMKWQENAVTLLL